MRILITNDDGINSIGLHMLVKEIEKEHEVLVAAPSEQRSASGHSITIHRPLSVKEVKIESIKSRAFSIDGTPADCVKIARDKIVSGKIDMVLSGINRGLNLGTDVLYSGTVSAAIEGAIYKIPSAAISLELFEGDMDYSAAAVYAAKIINTAYKNSIQNDVVLNINVPYRPISDIKGIKVCHLGNRIYTDCYIETSLDNSCVGFMLGGTVIENDEKDTDVFYLNEGYVTLTPLHYDLTNFKLLSTVENWF